MDSKTFQVDLSKTISGTAAAGLKSICGTYFITLGYVTWVGGTTVILKKIQSDRFLMTTHIFRDSGSISRSRRDDVARNLG